MKTSHSSEKRGFNLKVLLMLHGILLILSFSGVMSKMASQQNPFSIMFFAFYGMMLLILAVYALAWQQVIKRLTLSFAYANRAITVVWGIVWGALWFDETITPLMVVGALVIIVGIVLYATAGTGDNKQ